MHSTSTHVQRLLNHVARRNAEDERLLRALAADVLQGTHVEGWGVDGDPTHAFYVFSRYDFAQFLRAVGFQKWFASTWLVVDDQGRVDADVVTAAADRPTESFQPVADHCLRRGLAEGWVREHDVGRHRLRYHIEIDGLAAFLQAARTAAIELRDWQRLAVRSAVNRQMPH